MGRGLTPVLNLVHSVADMIFPRLCEVCGRPLSSSEEVMCLHCRLNLPYTDLHRQPFNTIHHRLASVPAIEGAGAMFHYIRNDPYMALIHHAKYSGRPYIFDLLGRKYAATLLNDGFLDSVDAIQPVPMHWWKKLRRGYNQTEVLAHSMAEVAGVPVLDCLKVVRHHQTQTHKSRYQRWLNARDAYCAINADQLADRHILLVDDVITTGSTLIACARAMKDAEPSVRISIASLAVTAMQ